MDQAMSRRDFAHLADVERKALAKTLEWAYPLAKQLAEILELEGHPLERDAKRLRQSIGSELARLGRPIPEFF